MAFFPKSSPENHREKGMNKIILVSDRHLTAIVGSRAPLCGGVSCVAAMRGAQDGFRSSSDSADGRGTVQQNEGGRGQFALDVIFRSAAAIIKTDGATDTDGKTTFESRSFGLQREMMLTAQQPKRKNVGKTRELGAFVPRYSQNRKWATRRARAPPLEVGCSLLNAAFESGPPGENADKGPRVTRRSVSRSDVERAANRKGADCCNSRRPAKRWR